MTRLLGVELTRLRWRRAVLLLLLAAFVVPALIWSAMAWNTRPLGEDDLVDARRQAAADAAMPWVREEIANCEANPQQYGVPTAAACAELVMPSEESYLYRPQLDVAEMRGNEGLAVITLLVMLLMILGTTFVGHDWSTGSMSNQLLFEPRRDRVWLAKGLAVFLVGLVTAAAALALFWAATWLLAEQRDVQATAHQWALIRNSALRGTLLVGLAGLTGYALTMLFRSTVATLGVFFAAALGGSLLVIALFGEGAVRWLPPINFTAVVLGRYEYYDPTGCVSELGDCTRHLTLTGGATYLAIMLALAVGLSVWSFRRRDVP